MSEAIPIGVLLSGQRPFAPGYVGSLDDHLVPWSQITSTTSKSQARSRESYGPRPHFSLRGRLSSPDCGPGTVRFFWNLTHHLFVVGELTTLRSGDRLLHDIYNFCWQAIIFFLRCVMRGFCRIKTSKTLHPSPMNDNQQSWWQVDNLGFRIQQWSTQRASVPMQVRHETVGAFSLSSFPRTLSPLIRFSFLSQVFWFSVKTCKEKSSSYRHMQISSF